MVNEFNSMDYPLDDPAVVVLLADDISINQCLALSTIPILQGIMPLQQGVKDLYVMEVN